MVGVWNCLLKLFLNCCGNTNTLCSSYLPQGQIRTCVTRWNLKKVLKFEHHFSLMTNCIEIQPLGDIFIFDYEALLILEYLFLNWCGISNALLSSCLLQRQINSGINKKKSERGIDVWSVSSLSGTWVKMQPFWDFPSSNSYYILL